MEDGTLRVTNITKLDEGRYTCVARNHFGASSSSGLLVVKGMDATFGIQCLLNKSLSAFVLSQKNYLNHEIDNKYKNLLCPRRLLTDV